jgi:hypothetical protein
MKLKDFAPVDNGPKQCAWFRNPQTNLAELFVWIKTPVTFNWVNVTEALAGSMHAHGNMYNDWIYVHSLKTPNFSEGETAVLQKLVELQNSDKPAWLWKADCIRAYRNKEGFDLKTSSQKVNAFLQDQHVTYNNSLAGIVINAGYPE